MKNIFEEIRIERQKQDEKWGVQNHPCLDLKLMQRSPDRMCEEYEIPTENRAKQLCEIAFEKQRPTFAHIAAEEFSEVVSAFDIHKRRAELIQLTSVCVAWIEKIDRELNTKN
ncbi:MAG: hypothetical protein ACOVLC_06155 [Flavobacterium sp.]